MKYAIVDSDGITVQKTGTIFELFPNVSFGRSGPSSSFITENNLVEIIEQLNTTKPTQKLSKVDVYLNNGKAYSCKVETATSEEQTIFINTQWVNIREERDEKLRDTDWRASSDLTLSDAWKDYRQALRDITTQSDPYNITWPTPPS